MTLIDIIERRFKKRNDIGIHKHSSIINPKGIYGTIQFHGYFAWVYEDHVQFHNDKASIYVHDPNFFIELDRRISETEIRYRNINDENMKIEKI